MSGWDALFNVLGWGLSILLGLVIATLIFLILLGVVRTFRSERRPKRDLTSLRKEAFVISRRMYDMELYFDERQKSFVEGVTWAYGALNRK